MNNDFVYVVSLNGADNAKNSALNILTIIGIFDNINNVNKAVDNILVEFPEINRSSIMITHMRLNKQYAIDHNFNNNTYIGEINLIFC